jgi:hypothetical protein
MKKKWKRGMGFLKIYAKKDEMYPTFFIPNGLLVGLNVFLTYLI